MMWRRALEVDIEKAKEVDNLLKEAKNNIERKRIMAMSAYLRWLSYIEIEKAWLWTDTVMSNIIKKYKINQTTFYKTNYNWKPISQERQIIYDRVREIIDNWLEKWDLLDLEEVQRRYNNKYWKHHRISYKQTWDIVRDRLKYKYQKPYIIDKRKPENADQILKERFEEAINEIAEQEWIENCENKKQNSGIMR